MLLAPGGQVRQFGLIRIIPLLASGSGDRPRHAELPAPGGQVRQFGLTDIIPFLASEKLEGCAPSQPHRARAGASAWDMSILTLKRIFLPETCFSF